MKKDLKKSLLLLFVLIAIQTNAQIDNLSNLSPEWIKTAGRNAAFDGTDGVAYNPAGLTKLKEGFHLSIGNQSLMRKPSHEYDLGFGSQKFEQDGNDLFVPNLYFSYNKPSWAVWAGAYISGGGAVANYPKGSINTDFIGLGLLNAFGGAYAETKNQYLKASSYYLTGTVGVSFEVDEALSFALGIRYLNAQNKTEAGTTLTSSPVGMEDAAVAIEANDIASGFAGVFGVHATPCENFNISFRFESAAKLDFTTEQVTDNLEEISGGTAELVTDGEKHRRDLPGIFGLGLGYDFSKKFRVSAEMNYYMQTMADWGAFSDDINLVSIAGDAINYGASIEYKFTPGISWGLGGTYTILDFGDKDAYYTSLGVFETVPANNFTAGTGFTLNFTDNFRVNVAAAKTFYEKDEKIKALIASPMDLDVTVNNDVLFLGVGLDFTF